MSMPEKIYASQGNLEFDGLWVEEDYKTEDDTLYHRHDLYEALEAQNKMLAEAVVSIKAEVDKQANDDGLWFYAKSASEGYLQQELRKLHEAIENHAEAIALAQQIGGK